MARRRKKKGGLADGIFALIFLSIGFVLLKDHPLGKAIFPFILLPVALVVAAAFLKIIINNLTPASAPEIRSGRTTRKYSGAEIIDLHPDHKPSAINPPSIKTDIWSLELLRSIEWKRFEDIVAEYFILRGYKAETTNLGKDGGVDVIVYGKETREPVSVVQCKAWGNRKVTLKEVRELLGAVVDHKVKQGIFITTSDFTADANEFGKQHNIVLINGTGFIKEIKSLESAAADKLLRIATEGDYWVPSCPQCGEKMVERQNHLFRNYFWGCSRFPRCKGKLSMRTS